MRPFTRHLNLLALLAATLAPLAVAAPAASQPSVAQPAARPRTPANVPPGSATGPAAGPTTGNRIIAVVNGDVVTESELRSRARLFALNAGMAPAPDLVNRIRPQVVRLLIEERLRLQEVARRRVPVGDDEVAEAIGELERRNGLPSGALRAQLREAGVEPRVLYDQLRAQIGWSRLTRGMLGAAGTVSEDAIREQVAAQSARVGQPEFLVSEIFIPVDDPATAADTRRFVDDVIGRLRAGLPFPIAATQFSQANTALQGGDLGWVRADQMDPEVSSLLNRMPPGAVSNAVPVAGGFQIVALRQRRESGREPATMISLRQAFLPFTAPLNPQAPTEQQRAALTRAQGIRGGCEAVEAVARTSGSDRPADPGPIRLESLNPPTLRTLISGLTVGRASQPVVTPEGILVIAVCSRETRNLAEYTPDQARAQLLRERAETQSRQMIRDLRRRAVIEMRDQG